MPNDQRQKALRYAELAFSGQRTPLSELQLQEMKDIVAELGMEHHAILEFVAQNLFPDSED